MNELNEIMRISKEIDRLDIARKKSIENTFKKQDFELQKLKRENQGLKDERNSLKSEIQVLKMKLKQNGINI